MTQFAAELIGTALLVLLGNGVVANVLLRRTKGEHSGWIVITTGWGLAVFVAVCCTSRLSGAHINPAVTLGLAAAGSFPMDQVPTYLTAQFLGGALGSFFVWLHYRPHFSATSDGDLKLAVFCTGPAIRDTASNVLSEVIGTFVLIFAILQMAPPDAGLGALDALPVGLLVWAIGLSLGGTTGYAINPARDLGPRVMHSLLPIAGKRDSDWSYSWIPVAGPMLGGLLAAVAHRVMSL